MNRKEPVFPYVEPYEVEIPAQQETFEAQVLVMMKPYKLMIYPGAFDSGAYMPLQHVHRVLQSGHFHAEIVPSSLANGKPTLVITEDEV